MAAAFVSASALASLPLMAGLGVAAAAAGLTLLSSAAAATTVSASAASSLPGGIASAAHLTTVKKGS